MTWKDTLKRLIRSDGWENVVTQLGTSYDKSVYHRVYPEAWYACDELEAFYYGDPFAQRVVREPVDAAFRQGYDLVTSSMLDPELVEEDRGQIRDKLFDLDAQELFQESLYWGRLYGRGALLLGVNDGGALTQPLNPEKIRSLDYVEPLTCDEFSAVGYQDDPLKPNFGEPEIWQVQRDSGMSARTEQIHASRLILARGVPTTKRKRAENEWRDASVLQAPYMYFRNWDAANQGAANMMTDASQAVLKIRRFAELLGSTDLSIFTNRMRILEMARSLRIMPIDAEHESFEYVERSFAGVFEMLDRAAGALAGAVGMPQTVLFGRSPAGLNATGESDIRGWYDQVGSERVEVYQPGYETLIYYVAVSLGISNPETWGMDWHSLWQESDKESADTNKAIADTDQIYLNLGAVTEDEISETRFGGDTFNRGVIQIDVESREALREPVPFADPDQDQEPELEGETKIEPTEAVDPQTALNGAQVKSLMDIVLAVSNQEIPRETGVSLITAAFPLSTEQANQVMGSVGKTFFAEEPEPEPEDNAPQG